MFIHYRTRGFVIKKIDRGEADQVFVIFTKDFGRLRLLARAARKIKSKLRGGLKLFSLSEIEFIQGKTYKTLTDAQTVKNFDRVSKSLIRLKTACKIGEILNSLVKEEERDENIWNLIGETFKKLNDDPLKAIQAPLVYYYFFWNLIDLIGYRPSVYNCAACQKKIIPEPLYFNSEQGGVVCSNCYKKLKSGKKISADLVKILRVVFGKNWKNLVKLKIKPAHYRALKNISDNYYQYLIQ